MYRSVSWTVGFAFLYLPSTPWKYPPRYSSASSKSVCIVDWLSGLSVCLYPSAPCAPRGHDHVLPEGTTLCSPRARPCMLRWHVHSLPSRYRLLQLRIRPQEDTDLIDSPTISCFGRACTIRTHTQRRRFATRVHVALSLPPSFLFSEADPHKNLVVYPV